MRVLIVSHMYPNSAADNFGIFVHQQALELAKITEVRVVSPVPWAPAPLRWLKKKWKAYASISCEENIEGIKVFHPRYLALPGARLFEYSGLFHYAGIKRLVKKLEKEFNFDLIHCHTALPDGYSGMLLARHSGKPLVVTVHGHDMAYTVNKNSKCRKTIEAVFNSAAAVITVSNKLADQVRKHCSSKEKVKVLNNGINNEKVYRGKSPQMEAYRDNVVLLCVAHLVKLKGINFVIEALPEIVSRHSNAVLLIIGDGSERKALEGQVSELDLQEHVKFFGGKSHEEVMEYMSFCDVFILPSWNEGFGIVYLEAMAHDKPVIACKGQGIEDVIINEENGLLIEPGNAAPVAGAVLRLLGNQDFARSIGKKAGKLVRENHTWRQNAVRLKDIYLRLCDKK